MPHTVLLVDDSPTAGPELRAMLEAEGYRVMPALRAEEALDCLRNGRVDLVITEALLPGMDGYELVRHIRANRDWAQIPIVMLTVRGAPEDYAKGYEAGVNEYFLKPAEPPKILAASAGLITRYEMMQAQLAAGVATPEPIGPRRTRGDIITVFSLKGGVGTTTMAINIAVGIKRLEPTARVGLIDLSLEEALDAVLLDVVPTSTIADWSAENLHDVTPNLLTQYFVQHRSGIALMAAPKSPEQAETVRPDVVRKTLDLAPQVFDYTVLDTASTFSENSLIALEMAQSILLPVTPDMAALKTAVSTMNILKALQIPEDRVRVILNDIVPGAAIGKSEVEASLGVSPLVVPHGGPDVVDTANQGMPLVTSKNTNPAAASILELAASLCEPTAMEDGRDAKGLLGKLRTDLRDRLSRA